MTQKRVLLITVRADHGGGPRHVDILINNLSEDISLYVACPNDKPYYQLWENNSRVESIFELPHRKLKTTHLLNLARFVKAKNITVVHSHGKGAGVYSRLLKFLVPSVMIVHTFHGVHTQEYGNFSKSLYYIYENIAKNLTNRFINVSHGEKEICLSRGLCDPEKQITIYNGVPDLSISENQNITHSDTTFRIVSLTRFDFQKHMQLAYEIASLLKEQPNLEFIWVGDGPDRKKLEAQAQKDGLTNIVFTGFSDQPDKYLKLAKAYLSTSRWEGLPLALVEAASLSVPIVATNVTGNNEVVEHGLNGYLYETTTPQVAADYILRICQNQELHQEFAKNARKIYEDKFTVELMVHNTERVYKS